MNLPPRQHAILTYFAEAEDQGRQASRAEAAKDLGYAFPSAVSKHIEALTRKGMVEADRDKKRNVRLTEEGWAVLGRAPSHSGIPVIGSIAAGTPILALENHDTYLEDLVPHPGRFALRVSGNSMIEAGINDGDFAIIEHGAKVQDGEIGAVMVDDEATLKRVRYFSDRMVLEPANCDYQPIEIDQQHAAAGVQVIGPLRSVYRAVS